MHSLLSFLHPIPLCRASSQDEEEDGEEEWQKKMTIAVKPPLTKHYPKDENSRSGNEIVKENSAFKWHPFLIGESFKENIHYGQTNEAFGSFKDRRSTNCIKGNEVSGSIAATIIQSDKKNGAFCPLPSIHYEKENEAFESFRDNKSIHSNPYTLMSLLKICTTTKDLNQGQQIHAQIVFNGFERILFISNALVNMYAKCDGSDNSLYELHKMFNRLWDQDVIAWTTLISAYVDHGNERKALECFDQMKGAGVSPNAYTYACALKACRNVIEKGKVIYSNRNSVDSIYTGTKKVRSNRNVVDAIQKGKQIHAEAQQKELDSNLFVGSNLVRFYASIALFSEAWEVFDNMPVRDVVVWTTMIGELTDHGLGRDALTTFEEMLNEGVFPTSLTYICILKACAIIGDIETGREFHNEIEMKGFFGRDVSLANSLVSMYARCGRLEEAQKVFDKILVPDVVSWNALISGYSEHGHGEETISCFEAMLQIGLTPSIVTFSCVLKACASIGAVDKGREIHRHLKETAFQNDMRILNTLVAMYSKCGFVEEAQNVFDNILARDIVSWNALISGYACCGFSAKALELFQEMQQLEQNLVPDNVTYSCVLAICGSIGALDIGRDIHSDVRKNGLAQDLFVCRSLISMYAECGSLPEAKIVFNSLHFRDSASWSLMIKYFGINHMGNMAMQCFEEMLQEDIKPDAITFTCLLAACNHASLLEEAYYYLKTMKEKFGITPTSKHYTCMLNLMSRSGHLYEAERLLEMLGLSSTSEEMWVAILSTCKTYGEVELGFRCFEKLVEINPEDSAWYVLMADLYAHVGRLSDAYRIDELRKHMGAKKKGAIACIEVDKKVHEFFVGEEATEEMVSIMNRMSSSMKMNKGHLPHLDLVLKPIPDSEKEEALCEHAEKLAIAFGLINTPQGTTLRVSKNLRMCIDCHNTSKIISKVEKREIIIRDSSCIHHFKDNMCSCGDMF